MFVDVSEYIPHEDIFTHTHMVIWRVGYIEFEFPSSSLFPSIWKYICVCVSYSVDGQTNSSLVGCNFPQCPQRERKRHTFRRGTQSTSISRINPIMNNSECCIEKKRGEIVNTLAVNIYPTINANSLSMNCL